MTKYLSVACFAVIAAGLSLSPAPAFANKLRVTTFEGTRDQVRKACVGEGRSLVDGGD